ncbi:MAG: two-component regulator propeller domain-containing protein [Chitinophagales bacterium]
MRCKQSFYKSKYNRLLKTIYTLLLIIGIFGSLEAQPLAIGEWRYHAAYGNVQSIAVAEQENLVYASSPNAMFSYDTETEEIQRFNKVNGLSDVGIQRIDYSTDAKTLVISYSNGNIDLLKENTIVNISALKRSPIANTKIINNIYFSDSLAFMSCSFGIMVLDLTNELIRATYIIGQGGQQTAVSDFTIFDGYYWAATSDGLKRANPVNTNLQNFQLWETVNYPGSDSVKILELENWKEKLVIATDKSVYSGNLNSWNLLVERTNAGYSFLNSMSDQLIMLETKSDTTGVERQYILYQSETDSLHINSRFISFPSDLILSSDGKIWAGDRGRSLLYFDDYDIEPERISPRSPYTEKVFDMDAANGKLWVATGGYSSTFNYNYNADGALKLDQSSYWSFYNQFSHPEFQGFLDIVTVKMHPNPNREDVYFGSFYAGLMHFDGENFKQYDNENSILKTRSGDSLRTAINKLNFDASENLWMTSYDTEFPITILTADDEWLQLKPSVTVANNSLTDFVFDDAGQVWFLIRRSNDQGLLVLNHGNTLDDPSDDVYRILRNGEGLGNLPSNQVRSIAKDKNGDIWVGTEQGIAVFYCASSALTENGCDAQQIFVEQDGLGAFLLDDQAINAIAVDGGNRKWIGTSNGLWLFSPDGTRQLEYFNEENSPLPSDNIVSIAIDGKTGEVFAGTERGIISLKGEATEGGEEHSNVYVYPNPVRHDYHGPIAVKGLVDDANVKFTDVSGQLIYETRAYGGQAIWNGRNPNGQRAKSGVYLVFSSNDDGSEKFVAKFVLIK